MRTGGIRNIKRRLATAANVDVGLIRRVALGFGGDRPIAVAFVEFGLADRGQHPVAGRVHITFVIAAGPVAGVVAVPAGRFEGAARPARRKFLHQMVLGADNRFELLGFAELVKHITVHVRNGRIGEQPEGVLHAPEDICGGGWHSGSQGQGDRQCEGLPDQLHRQPLMPRGRSPVHATTATSV